jgi:hypothetical protein
VHKMIPTHPRSFMEDPITWIFSDRTNTGISFYFSIDNDTQ